MVILLVLAIPGRPGYAQPQPEQAPSVAPAAEAPLARPEAESSPPVPATVDTPTTAAAQPDAGLRLTYDKGIAFAADDGRFALKIAFRNQIRFESVRATEDGSEFESRISIPRARLQVEGNVFGKDTRYKLELGLGDTGSFSFVRDLYVDKRLAAAPIWLRAGQWKRPFNRQELVSDFASEFNERANTAAFAGGGRDIGFALHNDYEKSPDGLEWAIGVFNRFSGGSDRPVVPAACNQDMTTGAITCATSPASNVPGDFGPAFVVRAGWNMGGIKGYSEGDLEGGPLRLAVGASYKIDLANLARQGEDSVADNLSHGGEVDAMVKASGASVQAGLYLMKLKSADAEYGVFVQPGYVVVPRRAQVAARFAYAPVGAREQIEARAAFTWFWEGHAWKWASDIGMLKMTGEDPMTMATDKPDLQLRSMLQLTL